jgi:hypothetical protein
MEKQDYMVEIIDRRNGGERITYSWQFDRKTARRAIKDMEDDGVILRLFHVSYKQVK